MAIVLPSTVQLTKGVPPFTNPLLTPETDESEKCLLPEKMTLQAAMALSGLSPDSFDGTLNRFYQQGAILLKSPNGGGGKALSSTTTTTTTTSDKVIISQDNRISTLSERLVARRNLEPYFEMLTGTNFGLQGTNGNVQILANLPSPPLSPSPSSSSKSSSSPTVSGNLTIDQNDDDDDDDNDNNDKKKNPTIIYQGRDILDLYSNIRKPFELTVSDIGTGTKSFFENRSLFSRTAGVELPAHQINECKCGYVEYSYF